MIQHQKKSAGMLIRGQGCTSTVQNVINFTVINTICCLCITQISI